MGEIVKRIGIVVGLAGNVLGGLVAALAIHAAFLPGAKSSDWGFGIFLAGVLFVVGRIAKFILTGRWWR